VIAREVMQSSIDHQQPCDDVETLVMVINR